MMAGASKSILFAVLLAMAAGGVAAAQPPGKQADKDAGKGADKDAPLAPAGKQKLLDDADRIAARVAKLRGLSILRPIRRGVMNKEQITQHLLDRVRQEYQPGQIESEELAMKRLGLLPADANYLELVLELLRDQIAGFYDPWKQQLYIADWMTAGGDEVMAHEIDHALQDQHFHLRRWMAADKKNADATLARQALVEGDGMALMMEFASPVPVPWGKDGFVDSMIGLISLGSTLSLGKVPLAIREGLVFPYLSGVRFVAEVLKTRSWKGVDEIYRRPPLSSEHILHPHTYARYERPIEVRAGSPAALRGRKTRYDNVLGQFGLSILLRQHKVSQPIADLAAAGWGGDRVAVYTPAGSRDRTGAQAIAVLYTVWDSEVDAVEFFGAIEDAMPSLSGGKQSARQPDVVEYRTGAGTGGESAFSAERRGDAVLVIVGAPPAATDLRAQVWKTWTVRRRR
jgi:hypothetical protein